MIKYILTVQPASKADLANAMKRACINNNKEAIKYLHNFTFSISPTSSRSKPHRPSRIDLFKAMIINIWNNMIDLEYSPQLALLVTLTTDAKEAWVNEVSSYFNNERDIDVIIEHICKRINLDDVVDLIKADPHIPYYCKYIDDNQIWYLMQRHPNKWSCFIRGACINGHFKLIKRLNISWKDFIIDECDRSNDYFTMAVALSHFT